MALSNNTATKTKSKFHANPVLNRLGKVDETAGDSKASAYGGIALKTAFLLLWTVAGMMLYLLLERTIFAGQADVISAEYYGFKFSASAMQLGFFAGAAIIAIITQLVAAFARGTIPVTGTIYSISQGFIISFIVFTVLEGYEYIGLLALAITVVVVFTMAFLYAKKIIRVTKKFRMILTTLVAALFGILLVELIGYLIPFTRPFVAQLTANIGLSIGISVLSIIIASLFLISDFAMIDHVVESKLPAKYEWAAAFGLTFTILWLYIKILDLLIQILGNGRD